MTLAEIIEEGEQAEQSYRDAKPFTAAEIGAGDWCHRFYVAHGPRLLAVARAASALFAALDHVTPGWRETTCVIDEDSDEVNVAWCGLENALDNPKAGQPPEAF